MSLRGQRNGDEVERAAWSKERVRLGSFTCDAIQPSQLSL
jgi:hypothetical protein